MSKEQSRPSDALVQELLTERRELKVAVDRLKLELADAQAGATGPSPRLRALEDALERLRYQLASSRAEATQLREEREALKAGIEKALAQLDAEANRASQLFRSLGLQPGDHVAFCMENHARLLPLAWGATYAGLYFTALSSRLTTDEMAYILDDCGADDYTDGLAVLLGSYASDEDLTPLGSKMSRVFLRGALVARLLSDSSLFRL